MFRHQNRKPSHTLKRQNTLFFVSLLFATTAYAGCPDPSELYVQRVVPETNSRVFFVEQPRVITKSAWVSDNGFPPNPGDMVKLAYVDIAGFNGNHRVIVCSYQVGQAGLIRMFSPRSLFQSHIELINPNQQWTKLYSYKDGEREVNGYTCTVNETNRCDYTVPVSQ